CNRSASRTLNSCPTPSPLALARRYTGPTRVHASVSTRLPAITACGTAGHSIQANRSISPSTRLVHIRIFAPFTGSQARSLWNPTARQHLRLSLRPRTHPFPLIHILRPLALPAVSLPRLPAHPTFLCSRSV